MIGCKVLSLMRIMTLIKEEAPANFVPAAAVIRKGQALFGMIGRKGFVGCNYLLIVKVFVYHIELLLIYFITLSLLEGSRISYIGLKSIYLWRNVRGEGGYLALLTDAEERKRREQTGLDTLVVYAVKDECYYLKKFLVES